MQLKDGEQTSRGRKLNNLGNNKDDKKSSINISTDAIIKVVLSVIGIAILSLGTYFITSIISKIKILECQNRKIIAKLSKISTKNLSAISETILEDTNNCVDK